MSKKVKNNKIFTDELKRTFPIYTLGVIFHIMVIYILYKIPVIIGNILDLLMQGNVSKEIVMKEVYALIFYSVIMMFPRIMYRTLYFMVARKSDTILRKKVLEHLQYVKPEYYDKEEKGAFLAYLSKELLLIRKFIGNIFFYSTRMIISPIIGLIIIGKNFNLILAIPLIPIFIMFILRICNLYKKQKEAIEESRKSYIDLSNIIEQNTSGFSLIKLYNQQANQVEKFKKVNDKMYKADYKVGVVENKIKNARNIFYALCYVVGFSLGLILINRKLLTVGDLTAYISCISVAIGEVVNSIQKILNGLAYFKQSSRRYNYFFNLETYNNSGKKLGKINKIEIKNLTYSYNNAGKPTIDNINIKIEKGERIGIIGQIGSGKTTLMNIISGFYEVPKGTVFVNDIDINDYLRDSIFENIGYSMQKNIITDDTIKNNIDIKGNYDRDEIQSITKKADIYEDIQLMRDGIHTKIGENGERISGGQKQRIQIARNLLNTRQVNIFDDSLSALDSETEKKVLEQIEKEVGNNILIIVSNKVSMMEKLDRVYLLVDGKIIDQGTHNELLEKNKLYQELSFYERVGDLV